MDVNAGDSGTELGPGPSGSGGEGGGSATTPGNSVPFEDLSRPFLERLIETVKLSFADPVRLFSGMVPGDIGPPLVYGLIIGTIAAITGLLWQLLFGGLAMFADQSGFSGFALSTGFMILMMFLSPLFVVVGLFIASGLYHVCLLLLGDGERGFAMTFRAVCYGGTPQLLGVVPICGGFVGGIWALVLVIMAGKLGHGTDTWKAILGYFLPILLCCCLAAGLGLMFGLFSGMSQ